MSREIITEEKLKELVEKLNLPNTEQLAKDLYKVKVNDGMSFITNRKGLEQFYEEMHKSSKQWDSISDFESY